MLRRELLKSAVATAVAGGLIQKVVASEVAAQPAELDLSSIRFEWSNELPSQDVLTKFGDSSLARNAPSMRERGSNAAETMNAKFAKNRPFMMLAKANGEVVGWMLNCEWEGVRNKAKADQRPRLVLSKATLLQFSALNEHVVSAMFDEFVFAQNGIEGIKRDGRFLIVREDYWKDRNTPESSMASRWLANNTEFAFGNKTDFDFVDYRLLAKPIEASAERVTEFDEMSRRIKVWRGWHWPNASPLN